MSTSYSKRAAELQEISLQLEHGQQQASDAAWFEGLSNVSSRLAAMQPDMSRMQTKAAEPDPNKRIYGKGMVTKVCVHLHAWRSCDHWPRSSLRAAWALWSPAQSFAPAVYYKGPSAVSKTS